MNCAQDFSFAILLLQPYLILSFQTAVLDLKLFHNNLQKNKHPNIHLQRPNDVQSNALRIYYPVAVLILYQLFSF